MQLNELRDEMGADLVPTTQFHSAVDYAFFQYRLLDRSYQMPVEDPSTNYVRQEVFALNDIKGRTFDHINPHENHGPFVLAHTDLRLPNIIVDGDMSIQSIIDWEWSSTISRQFFVPPFWISCRPVEYVPTAYFNLAFVLFRMGLEDKAKKSEPCKKLSKAGSSNITRQSSFI